MGLNHFLLPDDAMDTLRELERGADESKEPPT